PGRGEGRHELRHDCPHGNWQPGLNFGPNVRRNPAVERGRDAPGDGRDGVRVPAEGNTLADGVFPAGRFEERQDGLGHRALARHVEAVSRPDSVQGPGKVVAEALAGERANVLTGMAGAGEEYAPGDGLGPGDPVRVVVRDLGGAP